MSTNLESLKDGLSKLIKVGDQMLVNVQLKSQESRGKLDEELRKIKKQVDGKFNKSYQGWYTESYAVIRQLIPDRLDEFEELYKGEGRRKQIDVTSFNIQDWEIGIRSGSDYQGDKLFDDLGIVTMRFNTQLNILKAAESRFESSLYDLMQILQADLFDSELSAARELLKNGFLRGAGAVCGVVLEKHLSEVCSKHSIKVLKRNRSISGFNDLLKSNDVLDVPDWRFIQRLGDLRNLCCHNKTKEPTKENVEELISGVDKVTKTIF